MDHYPFTRDDVKWILSRIILITILILILIPIIIIIFNVSFDHEHTAATIKYCS